MIEISSYKCPVSPVIGTLMLAFRGQKLVSLDFSDYSMRFDELLTKRWPKEDRRREELPNDMKSRLDAYFVDRDLAAFDDLEVETAGTEFQNSVWHMLRHVPVGQTWTYGRLAQALKKPTASRAVGRTNGLNPIAIVLPCHRVIGGSGKLTGYAGGLPRKEWLLRHEGVQPN